MAKSFLTSVYFSPVFKVKELLKSLNVAFNAMELDLIGTVCHIPSCPWLGDI